MAINYDLSKMQRLVKGKFDDVGLKLDSNEIDGDFVRFRASLTLKGKSFVMRGVIGNHGFGNFEAIFGEIQVKADSLIAVNAFNDQYNLCKATISRRGNAGTYRLVFNRGVQFVQTEEAMAHIAMAVLDDLLDDDLKDSYAKLFSFLND